MDDGNRRRARSRLAQSIDCREHPNPSAPIVERVRLKNHFARPPRAKIWSGAAPDCGKVRNIADDPGGAACRGALDRDVLPGMCD